MQSTTSASVLATKGVWGRRRPGGKTSIAHIRTAKKAAKGTAPRNDSTTNRHQPKILVPNARQSSANVCASFTAYHSRGEGMIDVEMGPTTHTHTHMAEQQNRKDSVLPFESIEIGNPRCCRGCHGWRMLAHCYPRPWITSPQQTSRSMRPGIVSNIAQDQITEQGNLVSRDKQTEHPKPTHSHTIQARKKSHARE